MWPCRALLMSRSRTLFTHLHSVRRRVSPLGVAARRGHASDVSDDGDRRPGGADANGDHTTPPETNRHLYLLLDDAKNGFGVHKIDMDDHDAAPWTPAPPDAERRLPEPPLLRIEYPTLGDDPSFAVLGSNIIGMGYAATPASFDFTRSDGVTLAFDTKTAALSVMRDLPKDMHPASLAVAVANRLYVMDTDSAILNRKLRYDRDQFCDGCLHCLKLREDADRPGSSRWYDWWTQSDFCRESQSRWVWSDGHNLLPVSPYGIRAHAVHPGGRAFFVSVRCWYYHDQLGRGTFSYDTDRDVWTRHGDWELPFGGQAHYDAGLGAWVGLHHPDGYLCSCDVPSLDELDAPAPPPDWKLGSEKLFLNDPERHVDAKLVYMGSGGRFCLVEILTRQGVGREECIGDGDKCVLRLTTFCVKYGDHGELTTTARRPARLYKLSRYQDRFDVQAFWM
ncbi:unnamed protein product [Urochloa humidicola]